MKNTIGFFAAVLISFTLILVGIPDAEAKRFGGGGSFGGKSSFSSPYRRSTTSAPKRSASQQKAFNQNQTARQGMSRRGGLMGMLGGLALGGLLGAMFFGGAFEGLNFMDILMFAGVAYLLYRLFAAKASARPQAVYSRDSYNEPQRGSSVSNRQYKPQTFSGSSERSSADFDTDILFDKNKKQNVSAQPDFQNDADFEENIIPADFDEADFLTGAKNAFKDLQKAWDNHELAEIRGLTTDKVFAEIQEQLKNSNEVNQTDILKVDAELLSIREIGSELEAVVLFDTIIREDVNGQAEQLKEVWHFIKSKNSLQPKWYLDGIQQLEQ